MLTYRLFLVSLLAAFPALSQSNDSQTMQSLLQELRQIRQDLHGMTLVAQRVQILLYRIQLQDEATRKALLRYDQVNSKLKDAERNRVEAARLLKDAEEKLSSAQNPNERTSLEEVIREMKRRSEMWSAEESSFRGLEATAETDLRTEQTKLLELQQRLDRLERQLESFGQPGQAR